MKEKIKKNIVYLIPFTLGIVLPISIAKATTYISGSNIGYNGTLSSDNIQDAIDELYTITHTKKKIEAWEYHETGSKKCINGEEGTCVQTECYKSGSTCDQGTVIKYYVNDNLYHYFYVLRDENGVITMQQRENTIRNIPWVTREDYVSAGGDGSYYDSANNGNGTVYGRNNLGPLTILNALEKATSTWTNVDILEYIPGTDTLYENPYTGCTYSGGSSGTFLTSCGTNTYTLSSRKARARMITVLEASDVGCLVYKDGNTYTNLIGNLTNPFNKGSCPDFMHNYLYDSANSSYGGSYSDNTVNESSIRNYGYWTMSAYSGNTWGAWNIDCGGFIDYDKANNTNFGARAVVSITKSNL